MEAAQNCDEKMSKNVASLNCDENGSQPTAEPTSEPTEKLKGESGDSEEHV